MGGACSECEKKKITYVHDLGYSFGLIHPTEQSTIDVSLQLYGHLRQE